MEFTPWWLECLKAIRIGYILIKNMRPRIRAFAFPIRKRTFWLSIYLYADARHSNHRKRRARERIKRRLAHSLQDATVFSEGTHPKGRGVPKYNKKCIYTNFYVTFRFFVCTPRKKAVTLQPFWLAYVSSTNHRCLTACSLPRNG